VIENDTVIDHAKGLRETQLDDPDRGVRLRGLLRRNFIGRGGMMDMYIRRDHDDLRRRRRRGRRSLLVVRDDELRRSIKLISWT
jgi:hypothetical protein